METRMVIVDCQRNSYAIVLSSVVDLYAAGRYAS